MQLSKQSYPTMPPVIFTDGRKVFQKFIDKYDIHEKGFFIVGPSGSGKTHFIKNQADKHWIDGDEIWIATGAHPDRAWWTEGLDVINEVDQRSDIITQEARKLGLWIIGASNYWLIPDAIVLPDWEKHQQYIINRQKNNYDGGATDKDFQQVLNHRQWLEEVANKHNVPIYDSVDNAAKFLENTI